ncbi:peptidase M14 [Aquirufa nivalisilvae]|uniref:M14 family zinc carboxypeptidase n=1 Tax=Aquirufa nivalisilvae TaxID=2516557 RepID=UPI0022A99BBC|nr:M14 family zinc carboxypeptidase [Aquirufa nivalisilvae]MCZ2481532.1 peptidase M14 [Aquirufa nivalisilvae]
MIFNSLIEQYESFQEKRISNRRFSEKIWNALLQEWSENSLFSTRKLGETFEGKAIQEIRFGQGPIHIAAWSQMHGDEATATMALADIFLFLSQNETSWLSFKKELHQKVSIFFIPRLNADGANRWTRETALGIDMNRDARTQNSPEAKILAQWLDEIKPLFSFNLHDQNRLYSAGKTPHQTHIALLATAGDEHGTWTASRLRAAKIANQMVRHLQPLLHEKIAKWTDEFEARAFGDYAQGKGYGLVLLESGGAGWDLEKQTLRKYNACLLLAAFYSISTESWRTEETQLYQHLPTNERQIFDILIKNAPLNQEEPIYRADIGLNIQETAQEDGSIGYAWIIEDIGDLSPWYGLTEIDGEALHLHSEKMLKKEGVYHQLVLTKNNQVAFDLHSYTLKINS